MFFFFNDTATTEIYPLSLHDALPISRPRLAGEAHVGRRIDARQRLPLERRRRSKPLQPFADAHRSEEHTSELQSPCNLVCRLLLEKKKRQSSPNYCPSQVRSRQYSAS